MERDQGISRASREGAPSTNNSDNRRKEATLAGPPGLQHNDINSPRADSSGNKASQAAYNGDRETWEMDHLGLNDHSNKEGSLRKNSKNKKEGQKPPRGNRQGSTASPGERNNEKGRCRGTASSEDEEKPQAKVPLLHSPAHQRLCHRPVPDTVAFVEPYAPPGAKRCPI